MPRTESTKATIIIATLKPFNYAIITTSRFRKWLFLRGTRFAEFINFLFIVVFSLVFLTDAFDGVFDLYQLGSYTDFSGFGFMHWSLFFALGVLQLITMSKTTVRSNKASAMVLFISAILFAFITAKFIGSRHGVITTAPVIYGSWTIGLLFAAYEVMSVNKKIERAINDNKG